MTYLPVTFITRLLFILSFGLAALVGPATAQTADPQDPKQTVETLLSDQGGLLLKGKRSQIEPLIQALALSDDPNLLPVLEHWLAGLLVVRKADAAVFLADKADGGFDLKTFDAQPAGFGAKSDVKKAKNSTPIKRMLRPLIARLQLFADDPAQRLSAADNIAANPSKEGLALVEKALAAEKDEAITAALTQARFVMLMEVGNDADKLKLIEEMGNALDTESRSSVAKLANDPKQSQAVRDAADQRLKDIERGVQMMNLGNDFLFGLSRASILLLSAIGLAITFGVMRVINMAHGEFIMIGAYVTYMIQAWSPLSAGWSLMISIPMAFLAAGFAGIILERTVIRHLYGRPLETLLATFGVSLVLQQSMRLIFNAQNKPVTTPDWLAGQLSINPILGITTPRVFVFLVAIAVFTALLIFIQRSHFGLEMRAVVQNRAIARTMGINSGRLDALTFGLGSGIAGLAGAVLSLVLKVNPEMGQELIIPSFMVVVIGGVGNLWGTLMGALTVGMTTKLVEPWFPNNTLLATAIVLIMVIIFIQFRPQGIFAQKGRSAEL